MSRSGNLGPAGRGGGHALAETFGALAIGLADLPQNDEGTNRLGSFSGVMGQAGQVAPEVEPNEADRKSAERLGQRVASATARWARVS